MNPKFLFFICAFGLLSPIVLACILVDLSKRQALLLLAAASSVLLIVSVGSFRLAAVELLGSPNFVLTCLSVGLVAIVASVASHYIWKRQEQSQLQWRRRPTQREFTISCVKYLESVGWIQRTGFSTIFVDVCRLEKQDRRARFLFSVNGFQMDRVQRVLSELRSTPFGKTIVVTWAEPSLGLRKLIEDRSWHIIKAIHLGEVDRFYEVKDHDQ